MVDLPVQNTIPAGHGRRNRYRHGRETTIALVGNANVGKSAIFNQLTGLAQETGNWSGKTGEAREGILKHHDLHLRIVDLPGIYSFTAYSLEEQATREFLLSRRPDAVINVLDATSLERNLYFTLQLKEMGLPLVLALNFHDIARKKHINVDTELLSTTMQAPVVNTIAIKGIGVHKLVDAALKAVENNTNYADSNPLRYGSEIEDRIARLVKTIEKHEIKLPPRWTAVELLEGDPGVISKLANTYPDIVAQAGELSGELAKMHGEDSATVITAERYALAARIAQQSNLAVTPASPPDRRLDNIALHPVFGYLMFFLVMSAILIVISLFGGWLTEIITSFFEGLDPRFRSTPGMVFWNGGVVGFYAALSVGFGFIMPFFLILSWLGESGYLPRIAFLMDRPCHTVGLHGQASLPLITALGCNVPACLGCRVMENKRDKLLAMFLSTLVPCSARTSVLLGLVGAFVGWPWAVGLLLFQFVVIFLIGRLLNIMMPNRSPGIIMEIPEYRLPDMKLVWRQTWYRFRDFLTVGVPFIVAGSAVIELLRVLNVLDSVTHALTPVTTYWLGLPAFTGVLLIFGILRKEATLALLISLAGGAAITQIMTPLQMVVFTIVVMLYIPCISTMAVMVKEVGVKHTMVMVIAEIVMALFLGGIAYRLLGIFVK